ncbi:hypothetical protein G7Z17_g12171 [Cylindrodendrum hubeiense]|uniref:Uncharacterized protein n=1 Tax=Cylindrodendrum hubeiense TaxID=595255 RepID=A0A9P5L5Q8_9HYPO|nr:hypothetical protein G7Z17_g12171 [Cylindrodendrum hubeiense]
MKFSVAIAAIAVMAASAFPIRNFHKREVGGILTCTGVNATGTCHYEVYELEKCHQLPTPFHANINTFAPDGEDFSCYPRTTDCDGICRSPTGCTFGAVDFNYEHKYDLGAINWDTLFKSFDCQAKKWSNSTSTSITKRSA